MTERKYKSQKMYCLYSMNISFVVYIADPDLILPRGSDIEFTNLGGA